MVNKWDILYSSATGPTHKLNNTPNQDALKIHLSKLGQVFSVADGHGSKLCFRSEIGSKIAVKVAVETVEFIFNQTVFAGDNKRKEQALKLWAKEIISQWAKEVLTHLKKYPFRQLELDTLEKKHQSALSNNALLAYGSTVTALLMIKDEIYGVNLGDSDLLILKNGVVKNYQYKDENTIGNDTYSLCTKGSLKKFKYFHEALDAIDGIMLSTDGYRNSFLRTSDFYRVLTDIVILYKEHNHYTLHQAFKGWLEDTTNNGSGDDITAVVALRPNLM